MYALIRYFSTAAVQKDGYQDCSLAWDPDDFAGDEEIEPWSNEEKFRKEWDKLQSEAAKMNITFYIPESMLAACKGKIPQTRMVASADPFLSSYC